jgi:hypothetical protein
MGEFTAVIIRRYREVFRRPDILISASLAALLFATSVIVSFFAIQYATESASNSVTDIILSNLPVYDVDGLFAYGTILLIAFVVCILLVYPKRIPFTLYTVGVFYVIRSAFTSLTHIGPFPNSLPPNGSWGVLANHFLFGDDLFFSAHVGICVLLALIFWREQILRYIFIGWSLYMAAIVLLGHYHYSIDVASAYFITYSIYCLCEQFFPHARKVFFEH